MPVGNFFGMFDGTEIELGSSCHWGRVLHQAVKVGTVETVCHF